MATHSQKAIELVQIPPPPDDQRVRRGARFAAPGTKRTRYSLPERLQSSSPVGFRTRVSLSPDETRQALGLLSLERPTGFAEAEPLTEGELFEACALGVLSSRQSTNFRGHRDVVLGPAHTGEITELLGRLRPHDTPVLDGALHHHVVLTRPYRTPFTLLLTFVGHRPLVSLATVPLRGLRKKLRHADDIPTIGYLQQLHVGILADAMERATVLASAGRRRAQVHLSPFTSATRRRVNADALARLEELCGMSTADKLAGWRIALVAQVGQALPGERIDLDREVSRRVGAGLLALRSERIQPGVNQEDKAPDAYQHRQDMRIPEELTVMAGRAAYNAFAHWTGYDRERSKDLLLLDRVDVLTSGGKEKLRAIRRELADVTDRVVKTLPKWIDLPTGRLLSRNAARGKKAFALAGQRIYITGLSRPEVAAEGLDFDHAICAVGAAAARSALVAELAGTTEIPEGCDLLAGICLMAGPVNQNDIGKQFYGGRDLLGRTFPDRDPTSLLVWTLKAKTVADPIGNEEQLLNAERKGALVDLRAGPHEVVFVRNGPESPRPMRSRRGRVSDERAFGDVGNFVTDPDGREIPGNRGEPWPWRDEVLW